MSEVLTAEEVEGTRQWYGVDRSIHSVRVLADSHEALRKLLLKDRIAHALAWAMHEHERAAEAGAAADNARHAAEYREVWNAIQELRNGVQP